MNGRHCAPWKTDNTINSAIIGRSFSAGHRIMSEILISSPGGVLAVLCTVAAFWFFVEQTTEWKLFQYVPPLLFIYATPVFLNNLDVIPASSVSPCVISAPVLTTA